MDGSSILVPVRYDRIVGFQGCNSEDVSSSYYNVDYERFISKLHSDRCVYHTKF